MNDFYFGILGHVIFILILMFLFLVDGYAQDASVAFAWVTLFYSVSIWFMMGVSVMKSRMYRTEYIILLSAIFYLPCFLFALQSQGSNLLLIDNIFIQLQNTWQIYSSLFMANFISLTLSSIIILTLSLIKETISCLFF